MLPNQKWLFTLDNVGGSPPPPPAASLAHMYLTIARSQHVGIAHKKNGFYHVYLLLLIHRSAESHKKTNNKTNR